VIQFLHINPVVGSGSGEEEQAGGGSEPEAPTADELELAIEVGDRQLIEEQTLLAALEGGYMPGPGLAGGGAPPSVLEERPPPPIESRAALILEELTPLSPQLAPTLPSIVWPLIRNPSVVQRFLRRSYNPLHDTEGASGFVSISMWINERGQVESAEVRESSGHPMLDQLALQVFSDVVVFAPARSMGSAIPVSVVISIPFNSDW
jgi:TonB family protein